MTDYSSENYQDRIEYRNSGAVDHILAKHFPTGEYENRPELNDSVNRLKFIGPLLNDRCQEQGIITIQHLLQYCSRNRRETAETSRAYFFQRTAELFANVHTGDKVKYKKEYVYPKYKIRQVNQGALTSLCMYIKNNQDVVLNFPNLANIAATATSYILNYSDE